MIYGIRIEVRPENDALRDPRELSRMLRDLADTLDCTNFSGITSRLALGGSMRDINGNHCGTFKVLTAKEA